MTPRRFRTQKKRILHSDAEKNPSNKPINETELKRYATEQKIRMGKYKVGELDSVGYKIAKVFSRGDDFLIYEIDGATESESFRVIVDTVIDADPDGILKRYEEIKPSIDDFRSILYQGVHDKSIKHRAASAISTALRGDTDRSKLLFQKITEEVRKEYENISFGRFNYLLSAFAALIIFCTIAGIAYANRQNVFLIANPQFKSIIYAAGFAALGGFFSVCINFKDIEFERALTWWRYEMYGLQRIVLASICGVISYLLVSSDILLSFITKSPNATLALMAVCVLSGFSEKLIPNALKRLESKEGEAA